ncbi:fibronectin type III domain-containing protein, partial [bacterium]|nr:fibronectin type III domain-containing protein [bacterium]
MWHAARILILGLLCWNLVWAETMPRGPVRGGGGSLDVANPYVNSRVVSNGIIAFNLTNYGYFGNDGPSQSQALQDDCNGEWAPQFEYPEGSDNQYLFQGALWVGAIIVEEGGETKRVSVGTDGWFTPSINEFYPGEGEENGIVLRSNIPGAEDCFGNSIFDPEADANLEAEATFTDTLMDWFWIEEDPADGQHRPLGLEITQTAKCWTSPDFGKFVILDFHIENIGTNFLKQLALGLYLDSDVGTATEFEHHTDDIAGSIAEDPQTGNLIAWIADNDGRGPEGGTGPVLYPHCMGAAYLTAVDSFYSDHARSFNWWISNGEPDLDFGPSWTDGPNWTQTYGTPVGDFWKHDVLVDRERDYDQVYVNQARPSQLDTSFQCASDGEIHSWRPNGDLPNVEADDIANGFDTRFLMSEGPMGIFDYIDGSGQCIYRLNPGEQIDLTAVILLGEDFHDVNNPQPNPTELDPSLFSFEGLRESMARARMLYEDGYNWQPPTPVTNLHVTDAMDEAVPLVWDEPLLGGHAGYRVYGRPNSGEGARAEFTSGAIPNLNFTVTGLTNGDRWLFEVETWDGAGYRSAMAERLVAVGAIPDDLELTGSVEGNDITLTWNAVDDPTLANYRVMRRSTALDSTTFVVPGTVQQFVDEDVVSGRTY